MAIDIEKEREDFELALQRRYAHAAQQFARYTESDPPPFGWQQIGGYKNSWVEGCWEGYMLARANSAPAVQEASAQMAEPFGWAYIGPSGFKTDCFVAGARRPDERVTWIPLYTSAPTPSDGDSIRAALAPFADIGCWLFARDLPDDDPLIEVNMLNGVKTALTRGHFKAAHTALQLLESTSAPAPPGLVAVPREAAARDVLVERQRQIEQEGWTPEHDDGHVDGRLSLAAACYACNAATWLGQQFHSEAPPLERYAELSMPGMRWPWSSDWWKPKNPRRDLVRAAALILAEIERLDRKATLSPDTSNVDAQP